jgi:sugar phosphate isomerase/epimerase
MKICLNWNTAGKGLGCVEFVELAARAGFAGADVDMNWALEHGAAALADLYAKHGLAYGGWGPRFDWRSEAGVTADNLAILSKQAKIAAELGIDSCCTHLLPSSDLPLHQNWHFHFQRLGPIVKLLADHGLRFGLEFVSPYDLRRKWKHEFIFTPMAALELAADLGDNCGLLIDSFHLHAAGEPMSILAKIPAKKIVHVHINDAPAGPLETMADAKRLLPGQGAIDLRAFVSGLNSVGYAGPVSLEVFSDELKSMTPERAAARAWAATSNWLAGIPA